MQNREKQIEEMIETLKKCSCVYTDCEQECSQCSNEELYDEALNHIARTFYEAGYRKQSENTVEVVRCKDCEYWTEVSFDAITEWHWGECRKPLGDYRDCDTAEHDFCSYGEAKMKGGAE